MAVVAVNMTSDSVLFVEQLLSLGSVKGTPPHLAINSQIRPVIEALYQVLAGGIATGTVPGTLTITAGDPGIVANLKAMEQSCTDAINTANDKQGYSYVIEF